MEAELLICKVLFQLNKIIHMEVGLLALNWQRCGNARLGAQTAITYE